MKLDHMQPELKQAYEYFYRDCKHRDDKKKQLLEIINIIKTNPYPKAVVSQYLKSLKTGRSFFRRCLNALANLDDAQLKRAYQDFKIKLIYDFNRNQLLSENNPRLNELSRFYIDGLGLEEESKLFSIDDLLFVLESIKNKCDRYGYVVSVLSSNPTLLTNPENSGHITDARILRKVVKLKDPQLLALFLMFGVEDIEDKKQITAKMLANGDGQAQALQNIEQAYQRQQVRGNHGARNLTLFGGVVSGYDLTSEIVMIFELIKNAPLLVSGYFKDKTSAAIFKLCQNERIRKNPLFFVIENYFVVQFKNTNAKDFEEKLKQFKEILALLLASDNLNETLTAYCKEHYPKTPSKENSDFRNVVKALCVWDHQTLKEQLQVYVNERCQNEQELSDAIDEYINRPQLNDAKEMQEGIMLRPGQ